MTALLLDENLSEALLPALAQAFPGSVHVRRVFGEGASDESIWAHARDHHLVLVTRDEDFERLSVMRGAPPKVILLWLHNAKNAAVVATLLGARERIRSFVVNEGAALLLVGASHCD